MKNLFDKIKDFFVRWTPVFLIALLGACIGAFLVNRGLTHVDEYAKANNIDISKFTNLFKSNDSDKFSPASFYEEKTVSEEYIEELTEFKENLFETLRENENSTDPETIEKNNEIARKKAEVVDYHELETILEKEEKFKHIAPESPDEEKNIQPLPEDIKGYEGNPTVEKEEVKENEEVQETEDEEVQETEEIKETEEEIIFESEELGDLREFVVMYGSNEFCVSEAMLKSVGEHCNIWVVESDYNYNDRNAGNINDSLIKEVTDNSDKIYKKLVTAFAPHSNVVIKDTLYGTVGDVDNDGKLNILLYDIASDGGSYDAYFAGYFASSDMAGYDILDVLPVDVIHMDIGNEQGYTNGKFSSDFYGTIAHEFQHLLYYTYFASHTSIFETEKDLWFNESLSGLTDVYYSSIDNSKSLSDIDGLAGKQSLPDYRITFGNSNDYSGDRGYGDFVNFSNSLKNYGMGYMFASFMQEINPEYGGRIYDYFIENLGDNLDSSKAQKKYKNMSIDEIVGEAIKNSFESSHSAYNAINNLTGREAFKYIYSAFMESYISDGGNVIVDGNSTSTISFWNEGNLWDFKDYSFYSNYSILNSGGNAILKGFGSSSGGMAFHETTYGLNNMYTDETPKIHITVGDSNDDFLAYLVLYNEENRNSDIYPLSLGNEEIIDTQNRKPYLFINTFYNDVVAKVDYYWGDGNVNDVTLSADSSSEISEYLDGTSNYKDKESKNDIIFEYEEIDFTKLTDIWEHWAKDYIKFCYEKNLFDGIVGIEFTPNEPMNRGMFVTLMGRLIAIDTSLYENKFIDVDNSNYYSPYIGWASETGVVKGFNEELFLPEESITREELASILLNFSNYIGLEYTYDYDIDFYDKNEISPYALEAVTIMSVFGIMDFDDNYFKPNDIVTRGEVCYILEKFHEMLRLL